MKLRLVSIAVTIGLAGCAALLGLPDPALDEGVTTADANGGGGDDAPSPGVDGGGEDATDAADGALPVFDGGVPVTALAYHFRADVGVILTPNGFVGRWADFSPEAKPSHDAVPASTGGGPRFATNQFGTRPALVFENPTGIGVALVTQAAADDTVAPPMTYYVVARPGPMNAPLPKVFGTGETEVPSLALRFLPGQIRVDAARNGSTTQMSVPITQAMIVPGAVVAIVARPLPVISSMYVSTTATSGASVANTGLDVGMVSRFGIGGTGASASDAFGGAIAEILVYRAAHPDATRGAITTYLGMRYGIPISPQAP